MAFAGGWIDQPFVSRLNPDPPGSMVVVGLEPTFRFMDRAGMSTGTRKVATRLWNGRLPQGEPARLVRELYEEENRGLAEPSGSQDMIGLIYPGVSRLDFDAAHAGGIFPVHIESNNDPAVARWLESVVSMVPVAPRPEGYNPLGVKNLDPQWIRRLGQSGKDCYGAIVARDLKGLAASMNECMCLLGVASALRAAASHADGRSGRAAEALPGQVSGRDVLRLRRRLPVRRFGRAGARGVPRDGPHGGAANWQRPWICTWISPTGSLPCRSRWPKVGEFGSSGLDFICRDLLHRGTDRLRVPRVALGEKFLELRAVGVKTLRRLRRLAPMANRAALLLHGLIEDLHRVVGRLRFDVKGLELLQKRLHRAGRPRTEHPGNHRTENESRNTVSHDMLL